MRRVYYAYVLEGLVNVRTLHVLLAVALFYVFNAFVSVGDVLYNLSLMKVYQVDTFLYNALVHTDAWTLLILAGFVALGISFIRATKHRSQPFVRIA